jgi:hypothetical protein
MTVCCARAASGHAAAEPTITVMKSRRRIAFSKAHDRADYCLQGPELQQGFATGEMGVQGQVAQQQS